MSTSAAYAQLMERLEKSPESVIELGLDTIRVAIHTLRLERPAPWIVIIAGTNGKGTVAAFLSQLCTATGWTTTLLTSPHLVEFRERIRINGEPISHELLIDVADPILQRYGVEGHRETRALTYFELSILFGLQAAQTTHSDVLIMEVGLGGRLDATNAIDSDIAVFTALSLDHTQLLGDTVAAIAYEKAQVARRGKTAILHTEFTGIDELQQELHTIGAPIVFASGGTTARDKNKALAVRAFRELLRAHNKAFSPELVQQVDATFQWPGRLSILHSPKGHPILMDGAHNAASAIELAHALEREGNSHPMPALIALSGGRHVDDIIGPVAPWVSIWHVCAPAFEKMVPAAIVAEEIRAWEDKQYPQSGIRRPVVQHTSVPCGLEAMQHDIERLHAPRGLIFGSLYLVGDVYRQWLPADPHLLDFTYHAPSAPPERIG